MKSCSSNTASLHGNDDASDNVVPVLSYTRPTIKRASKLEFAKILIYLIPKHREARDVRRMKMYVFCLAIHIQYPANNLRLVRHEFRVMIELFHCVIFLKLSLNYKLVAHT